jgi:hypothetical protein
MLLELPHRLEPLVRLLAFPEVQRLQPVHSLGAGQGWG